MMIGFDPLPEGQFPGLRINRACEFAGMATLAQIELVTRTLFPALREEFASVAADEALLLRWEEATAIGALKPEVFCRPSDAVLGLIARLGSAVPARGVHGEELTVRIVFIHGWPYPLIESAGPSIAEPDGANNPTVGCGLHQQEAA